MTQPDVLADALQNPESTETPQIDYDALAEALTPIISAIIARQVNHEARRTGGTRERNEAMPGRKRCCANDMV